VTKKRDAFASTRPYLIDAILPAYEPHILGGPSGSGKTRWLFQMLENWRQGLPIFGFESHPVPYVYVAADRSYASVCDTLRDIAIDPKSVPIIPALDLEQDVVGYTIPWLFDLVKSEHPEAKLIVVEGIGTFVPDGKVNDYHVVSGFLRKISRNCRKAGVTILGIHHTSKEKGGKDGGGYENAREKLLGSAAWAAFAESIFMLDPFKASDPASPYRRLSVFPRNKTAGFIVNYKFGQNGVLQQIGDQDLPQESTNRNGRPPDSGAAVEIYSFLTTLKSENRSAFEISELSSFVGDRVSRATLYRRVEKLVLDGILASTKHGTYEILDFSAFRNSVSV
jgi:hypothetical protein